MRPGKSFDETVATFPDVFYLSSVGCGETQSEGCEGFRKDMKIETTGRELHPGGSRGKESSVPCYAVLSRSEGCSLWLRITVPGNWNTSGDRRIYSCPKVVVPDAIGGWVRPLSILSSSRQVFSDALRQLRDDRVVGQSHHLEYRLFGHIAVKIDAVPVFLVHVPSRPYAVVTCT